MSKGTNKINNQAPSPGVDLTAINNALAGLVPEVNAINKQTGNYTFVSADLTKCVQISSVNDCTVTVPNHNDVAFSLGDILMVMRYNTGRVDLVEGDGVRIKSTDRKLSIKGENGTVFLKNIGTNEWEMWGDTDYVYDSEFKTWLASLVDKIPTEYANVFNSFFTGLKIYNGVDSVADILDYLYCFGNVISEANAKINLVTPSLFPIQVSATAPTWGVNGYTGGASKSLHNGFVDSTNAKAFSLNDGVLFVWCNTDTGGAASEIEAGNWVDDASTNSAYVGSRLSGAAIGLLNKQNANTYGQSATVSTAIGLTAIERKGNNLLLWKNGAKLVENVVVPAGLVSYENYFLAINYGGYGSIIRNSAKEVFAVGKGSAYNLDQQDFYNRFKKLKNLVVVPQKTPFGTIFYDKFVRSSVGTDYTNTSGAFTANGANLVAANTSGGQWDKALSYTKNNYSTGFERTIQTVKVTVDSTASKGIAVGYIGKYYTLEAAFRFDTGHIVFTNATGTNTLLTSTGTLAISNGDNLQITVRDHKGLFTCKVLNLTTGLSLKAQYDYTIVYAATALRPSCYQPALYACGGTQNITYWSFTSQVDLNADVCFVGDSNFFRFYQNYKSLSIVDTAGLGRSWFAYGGPSLKTADINWSEIVAANPKQVFICLGTNDQNLSIPNATSIANLQAGVTALEAAGIRVVICKIPKLNTVDVRSYNSDVVTAFGTRVKPNFFDLFPTAANGWQWLNGNYTPDGVHVNILGAPMVAAEMVQYFI